MVATKATIENINAEKYAELSIPLPPIQEQEDIIAYLDSKTSTLDATLKELETQIADLRLYKASVITEAVTGQVDARNWTPPIKPNAS